VYTGHISSFEAILYGNVSHLVPVASPGFVARRGKDGNYAMGTHGELQGRVQQLLDD